jgi:hypothetical protein
MPPAGFEPSIPASERPQTHALDHVATETGHVFIPLNIFQALLFFKEMHQ